MNIPNKSVRFAAFIIQLNASAPASSREDAVALMKRVMKAVEDSYGLPPDNFDQRMNVFSLDAGMGWMDLDSDPCYWDDSFSKTHRTKVYSSGRIVITRLKEPCEVVLDKS